jgi:glyoxylase I family protein
MPIKRREALYLLAGAGGWPAVSGTASAALASTPLAGESSLASSQAPAHTETPSATPMPAERVLGIGGFFFRAHDPKALAEWYRSHLGINPIPTQEGQTGWRQEAGPTAFAPFSMTTKYLGEPQQMWMLNFRVRNLDKMAAQLRAAGVEVTIDPQAYPNGRFAKTHDPENNPIELWEPAGRDAAPSS